MAFERIGRAMTGARRLGEWFKLWAARGCSAVLDQGLFAVSNLTINVLLARWLTPREYGAFVAAYVVLLLIGVVHSNLLIEPMLVFGPVKYGDRFREYLSTLLRLHWVFSLFTSALLVAIAAVLFALRGDLLGRTFLGLAVAAPFHLFSWLTRRACYADRKPALAALGGAVYLVIAGGGAILLYQTGFLTSFGAQLLIGVAGSAAGWIILQLIRRGPPPVAALIPTLGPLWAEHWNFGRWTVASGLLYWSQGQIFYLILPLWSGLEAAGALRALSNFVLPVLQSDGALVTVLQPEFARVRDNESALAGMMKWSTRLFAIEGLVCWAVVAVFRHPLVRLVYGGRYNGYEDVLLLLGALPLLASRLSVLGVVLRARERTHQMFLATIPSAAVSIVVGVLTMGSLGIYGAVIAMLGSHVAQIAAVAYYLRRPDEVSVDDASAEVVTSGKGQPAPVLEAGP